MAHTRIPNKNSTFKWENPTLICNEMTYPRISRGYIRTLYNMRRM